MRRQGPRPTRSDGVSTDATTSSKRGREESTPFASEGLYARRVFLAIPIFVLRRQTASEGPIALEGGLEESHGPV